MAAFGSAELLQRVARRRRRDGEADVGSRPVAKVRCLADTCRTLDAGCLTGLAEERK